MNLLCFFGSGISKPSKIPMATDITHALLSEPWFRHTTGSFLPLNKDQRLHDSPTFSLDKDIDTADRAQRLLRAIHGLAATYLAVRNAPEPTYEEVFDLEGQVKAEAFTTVLNPAVSSFVASFREQTRDVWNGWTRGSDPDAFALLVEQCQLLAQSVVHRLLWFSGRIK